MSGSLRIFLVRALQSAALCRLLWKAVCPAHLRCCHPELLWAAPPTMSQWDVLHCAANAGQLRGTSAASAARCATTSCQYRREGEHQS